MSTAEQMSGSGKIGAQPAPARTVPLGGDYWQGDPGTPLWGFADLHAHLMAHLAFGGKAFWGQPYHPELTGDEAMAEALCSCEPIHGGLINVNPEFGHRAGGGWPEFVIWPRFTTLVHQQAYIDWLYRAYQGGLRLVTCLAVNNELLAVRTNPDGVHDDKSAIAAQVAAMKQMAAHVAETGCGHEKGWLEIAYSPEDARRIIGENRLAVVLGVEVDSLGNWRGPNVLPTLCESNPDRAREMIAEEVKWLYDLGVRQVTPIHLIDNAFGGTAIYLRVLEAVNVFVSGQYWEVEDAFDQGIRYRKDYDGDDLLDSTERAIMLTGPKLPGRTMNRRTLIDEVPGVHALLEDREEPRVPGGHANVHGLNVYGVILLHELMKRGILIDVDHMSAKATNTALDMAEAADYPVLASHTGLRDLMYTGDEEFRPGKHPPYETADARKLAHEGGKSAEQVERIARLGGVIAPIVNQGDVAGLCQAMPELASKVPNPCAGSSTSWAQAFLYVAAKTGGRQVAMGTDINGAAGMPGPRFGPQAAFGAANDRVRSKQRRAEIEAQKNGVLYDQPIRDYRWYRFENPGSGGYDHDEALIWQGIAEYKAGFNPWRDKHPSTDRPDDSLFDSVHDLTQWHREQEIVDQVALGLWAVDEADDWTDEQVNEWPLYQRCAYWAHQDVVEPGGEVDLKELHLIGKIDAIWHKWHEMEGENPPLARCVAGARRDFDVNLDGVAHYGLLPDMLQDIRNSGLTPEDLAPLFRGANDYVEMWEKVVARAPVQAAAPGPGRFAKPHVPAAAESAPAQTAGAKEKKAG